MKSLVNLEILFILMYESKLDLIIQLTERRNQNNEKHDLCSKIISLCSKHEDSQVAFELSPVPLLPFGGVLASHLGGGSWLWVKHG